MTELSLHLSTDETHIWDFGDAIASYHKEGVRKQQDNISSQLTSNSQKSKMLKDYASSGLAFLDLCSHISSNLNLVIIRPFNVSQICVVFS